jgi:hypothetical protein
VLDYGALAWLVGKVRQVDQLKRDAVFGGNAMVMRRRKLGLSDFPAEGEEDESKALLRELELASGLRTASDADGDGGPVFGSLLTGKVGSAEEEAEEWEEVDEAVLAQEDDDVDRLLRELEPDATRAA